MFEVRLLGPVEVSADAEPLALRRRQQRALIALLALNANRIVSIDRLIDALWGERPPASAPVALYGLVSGLRKLLEPYGDALVTRPPGYMLELPPENVDVQQFEQLVVEGRAALASGDPQTAAERLRGALALWRGPPLQDLASLPFAQQEAARLDELRLAALEDRIEADLARGRDGDLVPELEPLVAANPLREQLRGQLMRALYRAGRQADALAAYRDARNVLVDELGLEPCEDLQALERAILRHDPTVAGNGVGAVPAAAPPGRTRPRVRRRWIAAAAALPIGAGVALAAVLLAGSSGGASTVQVVANGVAVVDQGKVAAAEPVGASPGEVGAGAGSVWVTSAEGQTVSRIDPETGGVRETIKVGSGASGVAADERGVWVANSLDGNVSRIDPRANAVVDTIDVGTTPVGVAVGRGSVWVVCKDDQTLWRLDERTGAVVARIPVGASPRAVAVGLGAVWVADDARGVVFRVDPDRKTVVDAINVGNGPTAIVAGHGSVWVANGLDGTVSRIDPRRGAVTATIPVGNGPRGLAVGESGIWVSNEFGGTVSSIDLHANSVDRTVPIGERPAGIATVGGKLLVAVRSASSAHRGGTLRVAFSSPAPGPPTDTLMAGGAPTSMITNDALVGFRRVGGIDSNQLVPDLAVAIPRPTDGGRTYTFRLRTGIHYSDGRLLRARDVRHTFERIFVALRSPLYYNAIVGADRCVAAPARCDLSRGIVTDERTRTVTFHLRAPDPNFLYELALPYAFVVPADTPLRLAGSNPVLGTGPYMIASYRPPKLVLVRNPHFREWSKAAQPDGYPDRMELGILSSSTAAVRAVEQERSDVAWTLIPPALEREVRTQYASQLHTNPVAGVTYLFFNTRIPPFDDVRARRAVNYAADRAAASRVSSRGPGGPPNCQILPPDFPGFQRYCPYTARANAAASWRGPDLERARRLVTASGTRGALVTLWVPENHAGEGPFTAKLLRSLGYRVRVQRVSIATIQNGPRGAWLRAHAGLFTWYADYPAASNYFEAFFPCESPFNWTGFCDRRVDTQIRRALELQTTDPYLANRLWSRLDRTIVDRAPVVPLFALKTVDFVSRRVGNYQYTPQWGVLLDQLWVR